jgi:hypothetical protein
VFLVNSRLSLLPAPHPSFNRAGLHQDRDPFFRRYGVNLPSSLTEVRSSTWRSLPPPTSDGVRYGRSNADAERLFWAVWACDVYKSLRGSPGLALAFTWRPDFPHPPPTQRHRPYPVGGTPSLPRPRFAR